MFNFFLDCGEAILINHDILVRVLEIRDGEVVLGIESPGGATAVRGEDYAEAGLALADFER
jgi:sRNA-binding carbon storage regulator CsrA